MGDESTLVRDNQTLHQGLADLRQTWEHVAREVAPVVPELPGVIEQELAGLTFPDLNEETLIRVAESVVARVVAAGFPDEATELYRRMGRAMYELLLLLATQEEIRGMGSRAPSAEVIKHLPAAPSPQVVAATPAPELPSRPAAAPTTWPRFPVPSPENHIPPPENPEVAAKSVPPPSVTAPPLLKVQQFVPPPSLPQTVARLSPFQPRDPARPARDQNGTALGAVSDKPAAAALVREAPPAQPSRPVAKPQTKEAPAPRPVAEPAATSAAAAPPAAAAVPAPPAPIWQAPPAPQPPPAVGPPPAPPAELAPSSDPVTTPVPSAEPSPAQSSAPMSPPSAPTPIPKELTEAEAPMWGFDPAARESEVAEEPVSPPVRNPEPPVPATVAAASPSPAAEATRPATRPDHAQRSSWTVRLSPSRLTEQERKLIAREAELPKLVEEIVATAKNQQAELSSKGHARRALEAARVKLPLADGADPSIQIHELLEAGQLEEAATMAVQMATTVGGEEAAAAACTVGEGIKQIKEVELAVLCFTTAVLCFPPFDRACWQLCSLSVERRDAVMAPVWLEFVARLLRARGADIDAISVYRQLLKLAPRRTDIRELLRTSSLTGVLPD